MYRSIHDRTRKYGDTPFLPFDDQPTEEGAAVQVDNGCLWIEPLPDSSIHAVQTLVGNIEDLFLYLSAFGGERRYDAALTYLRNNYVGQEYGGFLEVKEIAIRPLRSII
jgi:hypothetical protein